MLFGFIKFVSFKIFIPKKPKLQKRDKKRKNKRQKISDGELIQVGNGFGHNTINVNKCKNFLENNSAPKPSNSQ